jgi:hypothetical protein
MRGGDGGELAVGGGGGAGGATGALCARHLPKTHTHVCARDLPKTRPCHTSLSPHVFAFAASQGSPESLGLEGQESERTDIEQNQSPGTGIEQKHSPDVEFYDARDPSPLRV